MSSSDNYYISQLNIVVTNLHGYGDLVIYILGTIGNILSIGIFLKKKWRKNVSVFYFLVCLLLNLIFLHVTILSFALTTKWNINFGRSSVFACKILFYITYFIAFLIPTILILASIDRLLISSQNVDTRLYSSRRLAYLLIGTSTVFWMLFNIHIPIRTTIWQWSPSYYVCFYDLSPAYSNFVSYSFAITNCLFCLVMIFLSILSLKNVRRIRAVPRQQNREIRSMTKKDFQLLRCLYVHIVVYMSVSIFISFFSVYTVVSRNENRTALVTAVLNFLTSVFTFVYYIFYCTSFFIFLYVSRAFRQEIKQLTYKILGKDVTAIRSDEEQQRQNLKQNDIASVLDVASASVM